MATRGGKGDLHGSAPDECAAALLIIDMINAFDFEGAAAMLPRALAAAHAIASLKRRAGRAGIPVVYVNDNFGRWRSDVQSLVEHCRNGKAGPMIDLLRPETDDYFVLKPKHSGFFSSTLETLLRYLCAQTLIKIGRAHV